MEPSDTTPDEAATFPASARQDSASVTGEPPYDVTMTFWRRRLLRGIAQGHQPICRSEDAACELLVGAGLVELEKGPRYVLTAEGRAYLAAHEQVITRRLPRPRPPVRPDRWEVDGLGGWYYRGDHATHAVTIEPDEDETEADVLDRLEERATSVLALVRYLRQLAAYQSREARDGASRPPQRPSDGDTSIHARETAGAGEPSPAEVSP